MKDKSDDIVDDFSVSGSIEKERHGCVTSWLIFMLGANIMGSIATAISTTGLGTGAVTPEVFGPLVWVLSIIGLANAFLAYLLLQWKKIGFKGFAIVAVLTFCINTYIGLGVGTSLAGFFGVGLLYGILQIKNNRGRSTWELLD